MDIASGGIDVGDVAALEEENFISDIAVAGDQFLILISNNEEDCVVKMVIGESVHNDHNPSVWERMMSWQRL